VARAGKVREGMGDEGEARERGEREQRPRDGVTRSVSPRIVGSRVQKTYRQFTKSIASTLHAAPLTASHPT
jgi:hypothetical protein